MVHRNYHNGLKATFLLGGMWALLLIIGTMIIAGMRRVVRLFVFAGIGFIQAAYSYWNPAATTLRSMSVYRMSKVQYPQLYAIVRELTARAQQPMPSVWVALSLAPSVFTTGRNSNNVAVCCTEDILATLDECELRGVLGHELMHAYNRDILTTSVVVAMGGVIASVVQSFTLFDGCNGRDDSGGMRFVGTLVPNLLVSFASMFIQFSLSHTREFDVNEDGVILMQNPLALASALHKPEVATDRRPMEGTPHTRNVTAMMIMNPFRGQSVMCLSSTHPPMEQHIVRLEKIAGC